MKTTSHTGKSHMALSPFHPSVRRWFEDSFASPTAAQTLGWEAISGGQSTLILAPTGSGKTLSAFLWCINRLMFSAEPDAKERCRVLYVSPLKALAVDVERNLRAPIAGIANVAAAEGTSFHIPTISIRSGDTPQSERARFLRHPSDILITTPESLYLILTSNARELLRSVETVIVDEIHALVPSKRGSHLAISLERLEKICSHPPQRIGLSATQHPLEEVARFLGGAIPAVAHASISTNPLASDETSLVELENEFNDGGPPASFRPVTIVDTGEKKRLSLVVEVPVEDMQQPMPASIPSGPASSSGRGVSIWPAIHPRLLELIRAHRSTLIFVNSRRLAERLAAALNELAGEAIVNAHHGSIARAQRTEIEDRLKSGLLPALVATSSLELGIDMGAIDLVIQIEAPPSIASGMQRIGRASHQVGAVSEGIIFPKYRGDLLACAALTEAMHSGRIEPIRYPRNALDVLAQQIVAMVSMEDWTTDDLFTTLRCAAPYAALTRSIFDGVLDMLSGVYPSDEFAELRPRLTWNRLEDTLKARPGARQVAVLNGGTIPDRGLYGVFLAGAETGTARVGELDEEMVFESRRGETFVLGASSWRIEEITHDRVLVSPAPGQPGKMPFWHGDSAGRTVQLGQRMGELIRMIAAGDADASEQALAREHDLDRLAARNLVQYVTDQRAAAGTVPDDRTIVIERSMDELGSWRLCLLSPLGGRVHAAWAMAAVARVRRETSLEVESMWSDDGFIIRFPETEAPPDPLLLVPGSDEVEDLVVRQLGGSSLFAARFREVATRALLLPRRGRPDRRSPLWQQRKRSADLLAVAARFGSFPMLLETYRECLMDVFDMPALRQLLKSIENRTMQLVTVDMDRPSPFAGSLLFRYVASFLYDGDAPLAERRAQALSIDQSQLRELLGEAELRELLDSEAIELTERRLQRTDPEYQVRHADGIHDLLLSIGDLSSDEIRARCSAPDSDAMVAELLLARRVIEIKVAGQPRFIAVEDSSRYRDALGAPLPTGLPQRLLQPVADPLGDLLSRYARTHGPFTSLEAGQRFALGRQTVEMVLQHFVQSGRIIEGEFRPGGTQREFCDSNVLRALRRRSLAALRHEIEPVEPKILGRMQLSWQGIAGRRGGLNPLLEAIESLQGSPLAASILETEILPARLGGYSPSDLDTLSAAGEVVWIGLEPLGERDGRLGLYLTDSVPLLHRSASSDLSLSEKEEAILLHLRQSGASFFASIHLGIGDGFPNDTITALWNLVWRGFVTNDTFHALRAFTRARSRKRTAVAFRSRRGGSTPPAGEGRWSLIESLLLRTPTPTEKSAALAQQLLNRYGVLTREAVAAENIPGGFSSVYEVLKGMEQSGRVRRGYFVEGLAATQFAIPGALDLLRSLRNENEDNQIVQLAATDPANPYGSSLRWPQTSDSGRGPTRTVGARVILVQGMAAAYIARGGKEISLMLPENEPERSQFAAAVAKELAEGVNSGTTRATLITAVDGVEASQSLLARFLVEQGFVSTGMGMQLRRTVASLNER
ncbi:MAG: DEAD/DEAH box helicase [Acidobacteriota bacterium]